MCKEPASKANDRSSHHQTPTMHVVGVFSLITQTGQSNQTRDERQLIIENKQIETRRCSLSSMTLRLLNFFAFRTISMPFLQQVVTKDRRLQIGFGLLLELVISQQNWLKRMITRRSNVSLWAFDRAPRHQPEYFTCHQTNRVVVA